MKPWKPSVPLLVRECRQCLDEGIAHLAKIDPSRMGTVLSLDSFKKLRGTGHNAEEVRLSVETMFTRDWRLLQASCHAIHTVPPWLAFTNTAPDNDLGRTRLLPMCKVKEHHGKVCQAGINALFRLVNQRMDTNAIFGSPQNIQPLIEISGAYPTLLWAACAGACRLWICRFLWELARRCGRLWLWIQSWQ